MMQSPGSNPGSPFAEAGRIRLPAGEATELFEYAAYSTSIAYPAQEVRVRCNGYWVLYTVKGVITGGGRNIGGKGNPQVGDEYEVQVQRYAYQIDDQISCSGTVQFLPL